MTIYGIPIPPAPEDATERAAHMSIDHAYVLHRIGRAVIFDGDGDPKTGRPPADIVIQEDF